MVVKSTSPRALNHAVSCTVMSTTEIETRYVEVCERLAAALQVVERLNMQIHRLKAELASSEEFIDRMLQREETWEPTKTVEPPHHINID